VFLDLILFNIISVLRRSLFSTYDSQRPSTLRQFIQFVNFFLIRFVCVSQLLHSAPTAIIDRLQAADKQYVGVVRGIGFMPSVISGYPGALTKLLPWQLHSDEMQDTRCRWWKPYVQKCVTNDSHR